MKKKQLLFMAALIAFSGFLAVNAMESGESGTLPYPEDDEAVAQIAVPSLQNIIFSRLADFKKDKLKQQLPLIRLNMYPDLALQLVLSHNRKLTLQDKKEIIDGLIVMIQNAIDSGLITSGDQGIYKSDQAILRFLIQVLEKNKKYLGRSENPFAGDINAPFYEKDGHHVTKTLLNEAIEYGNEHAVRFLLERGANPNFPEESYSMPLKLALNAIQANKINPEIVLLLIQAGADFNDTSYMYYAALKNKPEIIQFLKDAGLDINKQDKDGLTILDILIASNQYKEEGMADFDRNTYGMMYHDAVDLLREHGSKRGSELQDESPAAAAASPMEQ